jgi:DNA-binding NtrC family response regulator
VGTPRREDFSMQSSRIVLAVDSDESMLGLLEKFLRRLGYGVLSASNLEEGLRLIKTAHPDIAIFDAGPDGCNGDTLANHFPTEDLGPKLVVMGRFGICHHTECPLASRCIHHLDKPFSLRDMVTLLHQLETQDPTPSPAM